MRNSPSYWGSNEIYRSRGECSDLGIPQADLSRQWQIYQVSRCLPPNFDSPPPNSIPVPERWRIAGSSVRQQQPWRYPASEAGPLFFNVTNVYGGQTGRPGKLRRYPRHIAGCFGEFRRLSTADTLRVDAKDYLPSLQPEATERWYE